MAIKKKHRYYRDSLKKKTQYAVDKYKIHRNKLTNLIRTAQKKYHAKRFEDVRNDAKRTWQLKESRHRWKKYSISRPIFFSTINSFAYCILTR